MQAEGISVVAGSTDPREKAQETVVELGLHLPVGYGLPLKETAATLGAYSAGSCGTMYSAWCSCTRSKRADTIRGEQPTDGLWTDELR